MRALLAMLALTIVVAPAEAQKNCSKGKACGNTCIARDKICHVGQLPAAAPPPAAAPVVRLLAPTGPETPDFTLIYPLPAGASLVTTWPWVAPFPFGSTSYPNRETCRTARNIRDGKNRVYFQTETDARREGFFPSTLEPGCQ